MQIIYIGIGGFLGAVSRFVISKFINDHFKNFPAGTLLINVLGSFVAGLIIYWFFNGKNISSDLKDFSVIGFAGAFTTMSAFAYESFRLLELSEFLYFGLNIFLNVILCLLAIYFGKELGIFLSK